MQLSEIISQKITANGPMSFHDFMELSLYHPELGYYSSKRNKIGKNGDYYTSPELTPAYGAMIARQLEEMWRYLGKGSFTVVEYGGGKGILCRDILDYIEKFHAGFYEQIHYCIVEKNHADQKLPLNDKVEWHHTPATLPLFNGCVLSNELLDNFPVHVVMMKDELMEIFVDKQAESFVEITQPASHQLRNYFSELSVKLPQGFRTEVNLDASGWLKEISSRLNKGYILTIDYGYMSDEFYQEKRSCGTLVCYSGHQVNDNPYINVGAQDITTHVNFSALCHWGNKYGLVRSGYTNQAHFLLSLGYRSYLSGLFQSSGDILRSTLKEAMISYTTLVDMGQKFKVLIQQKGAPANQLSGLKPG
jgi:SAM-dependent MidA family methyltransferase